MYASPTVQHDSHDRANAGVIISPQHFDHLQQGCSVPSPDPAWKTVAF